MAPATVGSWPARVMSSLATDGRKQWGETGVLALLQDPCKIRARQWAGAAQATGVSRTVGLSPVA